MSPKLKMIVAIVIVLIALPGIYFAGNFILANAIKSSYQSKNCEQMLSLDDFYISAYPASIADQSITGMVNECALYALAVETEGKKTATWQGVYNVYRAYIYHYPKGFFVSDAQEHGALALAALAKEQLAAKKYTEALATINTIQQSFGKTNAAKEAPNLTPEIYLACAEDQLAARKYTDAIGNINLALQSPGRASASNEATSLMSEVYTTWAKGQRDSGDFAGAETTLKTFKTWAEGAKKTDAVKSAQGELAQTYLAWGLDFQTKKQFEDAKAKFDQAISTDPDPAASDGPAVQTKAAQIEMYIAWGDSLIEKSDFTGTLDRYQMVVSLAGIKDQPAAKDRIADIYLKWAVKLSGSEDFLGALKTVEQAKAMAVTDSAKKRAETAQADIYQAFSQSTGQQAQQAIADATDKFCKLKEQPALPIFGDRKSVV
jgi:tetratricopeptide (TPR) repeat protein